MNNLTLHSFDLPKSLDRLEKLGQRPFPGLRYHLSLIPEPTVGPQSDADREILEWCGEWGLLGILPVTFSLIQLSPVIEQLPDGLERAEPRTHARVAGFWTTRVRSSVSRADAARPRDTNIIVRHDFWTMLPERKTGDEAFDQIADFFPRRSSGPGREHSPFRRRTHQSSGSTTERRCMTSGGGRANLRTLSGY